jgi:hypothetical protein
VYDIEMSEMELFTLPSVLVGVMVNAPPAVLTTKFNKAVSLPPEFVAVMVYKAPLDTEVGVPVITQVELRNRPAGGDGELLHDVGIPLPLP